MPIPRIPSALVGGGLALAAAALLLETPAIAVAERQQATSAEVLKVPLVEEFAVTGRGDAAAWGGVPWTALNARNGVAGAPRRGSRSPTRKPDCTC